MEDLFYCQACDKNIDLGKETVREHTDNAHPLQCPICSVRVSDKRGLEMHVESTHPDTEFGNKYSYSFFKDR